MTSSIETEAKFTIPAISLADVFHVHRLGDFLRIEDRQSRHTDIYLDSDDGAVRRHQVALRWRDVADGPLLATFKGPPRGVSGGTSGSQREEVEHEVSRPNIVIGDRAFPIGLYSDLPAFAAARAIVGDVMLRPAARIVTNRRSAILVRTTGGRAELAVDRTVGVRLHDGARHEFVEIELEVSPDAVDYLPELVTELMRQAPDLKPSTRTKLERVLESAP